MYKPIIFSGDMVKAILDGRKSVTRRVINPQPEGQVQYSNFRVKGDMMPVCILTQSQRIEPRYQPGDILWVKESWAHQAIPNEEGYYAYRANYGEQTHPISRWNSPRFMRKAAARLFLRVQDVGIGRVRDISYDRGDIWAEGIPARHDRNAEINSFIELWDSINAKRGYSWAGNPFVWVISFERVEKPEDWPSAGGGKV